MAEAATIVKVEGTLTYIDEEGGGPLSPADYDKTFERIADYICDVDYVSDPGMWGQGSTGAMEVTFMLHAPDRLKALIQQMYAAGRISDVTTPDGPLMQAGCETSTVALRDERITAKPVPTWRLRIMDWRARLGGYPGFAKQIAAARSLTPQPANPTHDVGVAPEPATA